MSGGQSRVTLVPARPIEVTRFVANVDRMRQILGVDPPIDPLMHLSRLIDSHRWSKRAHRGGPQLRRVG